MLEMRFSAENKTGFSNFKSFIKKLRLIFQIRLGNAELHLYDTDCPYFIEMFIG